MIDVISRVGVDKEGRFLKKLRCCVDGRVEPGNLILLAELMTYIGHRKEFQSLRFDRQPFFSPLLALKVELEVL